MKKHQRQVAFESVNAPPMLSKVRKKVAFSDLTFTYSGPATPAIPYMAAINAV
jgi:hypothetical protein